jgi:hypothetical protein
MTYDETREREQLRMLAPAIDDFINDYLGARAAQPASPRQTVFFFPGGMASELKRATEPFDDNSGEPQSFEYESVWLTFDTFAGGARALEMYKKGDAFRDKDDRIIVASGAVNLLGCTPHEGFVDWCANNSVDLFVFDWDWRRRQQDTVGFFVDKFWPHFRARLAEAGCTEALDAFSLIGHSLGGMIVNLILRGNDPEVAQKAKRVITVATPFYGYASQIHRWFEGEHLLNGPGALFQRDMLRVIASLPGLYTLHYPDVETFEQHLDDLTHDPDYPLGDYPSADALRPALRADPYNPSTNGSMVRYPVNTGFDLEELGYGRLLVRRMAGPMPGDLLRRFYNIRGVQLQDDGKSILSDTVGSVSFGWISPDFDAGDPCPVTDAAPAAGDGVQPAWTARLVSNDPARVITVSGTGLDHMFLMNYSGTIERLAAILLGQDGPGAASEHAPPHASHGEVAEFMDWLHTTHTMPSRGQPLDHQTVLESMPDLHRKKLGSIARRIMMDLMKRPAPATASHGGSSPAAPVRK